MAYEYSHDFPRRAQILCDKAFNIAKNPQCDGYQRKVDSVVYKLFDIKTSNTNKETCINSSVVSKNKKLAKKSTHYQNYQKI